MDTKLIEVRDAATFLPVLCVLMDPGPAAAVPSSVSHDGALAGLEAREARRYLLLRCGFPCGASKRFVAMTPLSCEWDRCAWDPRAWADRTRSAAHKYITNHWDQLKDGDVVDVEYVLGETAEPKKSERLTNGDR